ncbi:MAG: hypothetical protein QOJ14_831 [Thermoleophilaceae bacterium]|nr:hypothetical protein [Thermoleophilaceae bacterium]
MGSKGRAELEYWHGRSEDEGSELRTHPDWPRFYTQHFGLDVSFYDGKRILDVGCGPRGSLEWATKAAERVGIDPLVGAYAQLGAEKHAMTYVEAGAESIPLESGHFDVVTCFNALDHVDDLDGAIAEMTRIASGDATLLLITEVNHEPTATEPQQFGWDVLERFAAWEVAWEKRNQKLDDIYGSLGADREYRSGPGLLSARLVRRRT